MNRDYSATGFSPQGQNYHNLKSPFEGIIGGKTLQQTTNKSCLTIRTIGLTQIPQIFAEKNLRQSA